MRKILLLLFIASTSFSIGFAQDFSNKGKDFYLCFPNHVPAGTPAKLSIWITSDKASTGTITMANGAFSSTFNILANGLAEINIPSAAAFISNGESSNGTTIQILKKSIRIKVDSGQPAVVAYVQQYGAARSAASLLLPTNVLGKKYYAISFTQTGSNNGTFIARSQFQIIATKNNTVVTITPRKNGVLGTPFTVTFPLAGDMIQYQSTDAAAATQDITGTYIESIASGSGGCLPIAVFSGSSNLTMGHAAITTFPVAAACNGGSFDPLFQQLYPVSTWGKNFGFIPFAKYPRGVPYRVMASEDTTQVYFNGALVATLNAGQIYPSAFTANPQLLTLPTSITADKPICVTEYMQSSGCAGNTAPLNNQGDPDMVVLNPIEQNISNITIFSTKQEVINTQWVNVLIKSAGVANFRIARNGGLLLPPTGTWQSSSALPGYSYLQQQLVSPGGGPNPISDSYRLVSDSGFNAIAYGLGNNESYGYSAGTNVKDLYQQIGVTTQYGIETSPSVCAGSPFKFKISLPYQPLQLVWNLSGLPASTMPSNTNVTQVPSPTCPTTITAVCYDSTTFVNGKQIWWYSLPNPYTIPIVGTYPITLTAQTSGSDGCGSEQEVNFDLEVSAPPVAGFTFTPPGCPAEPVQFNDATITVKPNYNWYWNFGDGSPISYVQNPIHTYAASGSYTVRFASITTPGCLSDTLPQTIVVPPMPSGIISGTIAVCQNAASPNITFSGSGGAAPYTFTYHINNGPSQLISSSTPTIAVSTTTPGVYTYYLDSIKNTGSVYCKTEVIGQLATVTVNPLPTASISGTTTVCQNTTAPDIIFTGSNGTAPYTFSYTINSGPVQTIQTTSGNSVNLPVPTSATGTFTYTLVSVTDGSSTLCTQSASGNATVIVQATSTATISGTATVCQNGNAPIITFTASNGNAPFEFTYNINNGPSQVISTTASSNSVTLTVPMTAAGTFVYNLTGVSNTGTITCFTPITGSSATVIINPVPSATISGSTTVCQNSPSPSITFTGSGATMPYTFNYTINNIAQAPVFTTNPSTFVTVPVSTATFGTYVYALTSVTDGSSTACTNTVAGSATVNVNELPTATISGTTTACQAGTSPNITFTANGGAPPYTFSYTRNGTPLTVTTTVGNSVTVPVSTTTPGTFTYNLISVQESSSVTCIQNQTGSAVVTVHPKPTASFTTVGPYCSQLAVTFTPAFGITPTGTVVSWVWDYGDGTGPQVRPNGNPFTVTYATAGIKNVTFKTISNNGCESNIFSLPVTINSKPIAGFKNPTACLADANAQFYDTSTVAGAGASIVYWEWDFGDGTPIFAGSGPAYKNPLHAYSAVGQKTVTLIVTSNSGCKSTVVQSFFINGEVTRAAFTTLNPSGLCSNRPVQIKENSIINVGGLIRTDIYWDYVGAPTVYDQDNSPTPNKIYTHNYPNLQTDQVYRIRYFAYSGFNGVCQKDTIINITVRASPVAQFISVPDVCLNGGTVILNQGSASGGTGVYMGPGVTFSGGVYTFNPLATGVVIGTNNSVVYTVTSPAGCDSAKVQQIKVLAPPVVNSFAPLGNTCNTRSIIFHNTYTNGDGTVIKWIYNWMDGSPIQTMTTGADVTHVYNTSGPHTATLTLETGYGCRNVPFQTSFTVNPLPVPTYTFSNSVCLPTATIVFTNTTANASENTYLWSFELPSTSAANTSTLATGPSHTYSTQGPFSTNLVATNIITGCIDTSATVVINSNTIHPAPVLQFSSLADLCLNNGTASFAAFASETSGIAGGPGIFTSTIPGAITANGTFNPLVAGVGTHTITYTWTSTFNCPSSITQTVKVLAPPVVNTFTTIGNRCETNSITFHNTITQGAGTINTWIYDWGDATPVTTATNGNDITHTYAIANTYQATLSLVTDGGCKSAPAFPLSVVVNPLPKPNFTYTDTTCLPQAKVIFVNTTPNISDFTYNWNFDFPSINPADHSTQTQNVSYTYTTFGPHMVQMIAISGLTGCSDSITKPITSIHKAPLASFNISQPTICVNKTITVTNNSTTPDGTITSWVWNYGDNTSPAQGQSQPPHTYTAPGTDTIRLTITNSYGCKDDSVRTVIIYPYPVVDAGPDDFILEGGSIVLKGTATGNDMTYAWTATRPVPLYLSNTTILQPVASPVSDITYKLTVTARGGCAASDTVFIKVLKLPAIPNTFTPNNDGIHDFWDIKYLNSYPGNRVQVFNRDGKLVFESKGYAKPWDGNMNGKSLPVDTYYYIIEPGNRREPLTGFVTIIK